MDRLESIPAPLLKTEGRERRRRYVLDGARCQQRRKPILCDPAPFCERAHGCSQLGAKVEKPQPRRYSIVSDSGRAWGNEIFLGGVGCVERFWDLEGVSETFSKNYLLPPRSRRTLRIGRKVIKLDPRGCCMEKVLDEVWRCAVAEGACPDASPPAPLSCGVPSLRVPAPTPRRLRRF